MKITNKIGVIVDSFRIGVREGLAKAKEVGAEGVQIYAVKGEMEPEALTGPARKELKKVIESMGLEISALCGDLGRFGFEDKSANADKIEKSKRIMELAKELGTDVVTTHIGVIPYDPESESYAAMHNACRELCRFAESMNSYFAIETGPTTALQLKSFLDTLGGKGVAVNYDPANLVMVTGDDPIRGVYTLKDYIVHTHAKDGIRFLSVDPREVYGSYDFVPGDNGKVRDLVRARKVYAETAFGEGHVDFDRYFQALKDIGYEGYLTIEREAGDQPETNIRQAVEFIKGYR
ncbi:MAG: sugar phosphate isomerase/epimerase [Paenibacillus sp.]|jgi:sugar phosphate isomerase/epimerase|uniref:Sugar phosphate isomerase/epimerase n=1 Tax=Paenibacillus hemerocallicola TaxID=1172614 RepID=A0A5C4T4V1_9BACL|nr:sugar phosphate isomerase/epimerase family protein [Paenibacillus hemerocallicola]MDF2662705.1 sugar phosphate isomerase/epimerase [Paenibacillus sp.]TNJ63825.1 sugar phosphate isomerase/epimerase [Paenibacillus hemerocallicola]